MVRLLVADLLSSRRSEFTATAGVDRYFSEGMAHQFVVFLGGLARESVVNRGINSLIAL